MFTLIKQIEGTYYEDCDEFAQTYIYTVNGSLADAARKTWGLESSEPVIMVEDVTPGGGTELTRENDDYEFTVKSGGLLVSFDSIAKCEEYFAEGKNNG